MKVGKLTLPYGAGTGKVSTSDSAGIASWATLAGGGLTWDKADNQFNQDLLVNYGYVVVYEQDLYLPATAAVGSRIAVVGHNVKWRIVQAAGQKIYYGETSTPTGVTGALISQNVSDSVVLLCVVVNTTWRAYFSSGSPFAGIVGVKGYTAGGYTTAAVTTAEKLVFSTDTSAANTSATLHKARHDGCGVSEGSTKGYFCGGWNGTDGYIAPNEKITYSNDTSAALTTSGFGVPRQGNSGLSDKVGGKGYLLGGLTNGVWAATCSILTYSTDACAYNATGLTQARHNPASVSNGSTKGYMMGGYTYYTGVVATTDKITYSAYAVAAQTTANLSVSRGGCGGFSDGLTKGYIVGGDTGSGVNTTLTDKITFSTDSTAAQTTANLPASRRAGAALSQGSIKGYYAGGYTGANCANATMTTYSTDTSVAQTTANLSSNRSNASGLSDIGL
jgi:hypothetical protein